MASLPIDERGYPVPYFVALVDGKPDHRVIAPGRVAECLKFEKCWQCGQRLGRHRTYVIGPMCVVNRVSSEPPSHRECAEYAARACPFLTRPHARRREGLPDDVHELPGIALKRNPGVIALWTSSHSKPFSVGHGVLFDVGAPDEVRWFAEGREATRSEVMDSLESGCPALRDVAREEGPKALEEFERARLAALAYVPAAVAP